MSLVKNYATTYFDRMNLLSLLIEHTVLELSNVPENGYYWAFTTPNLDY